MPQKPAKAETEPEVDIKPSEPTVEDTTEIVLDENTGKPVVDTQHVAPSYKEEMDRLRNQLFYEQRQAEKRQAERLEQILRSHQPVKPEREEQVDELDQIAQQDWKKAVAMLAEKEAEKKLAAYKEQMKQETDTRRVQEAAMAAEERSKQKVLKEFPDLMDENSAVFKSYMQVFNRESLEDPSFLVNPRKHEIVASQLRGQTFQAVNPEIDRLKRVAAGSTTSTRQVSTGNRISLTQEEIDLCDKSNIPYAVYAKNKDLLAKGGYKEGVEIKS